MLRALIFQAATWTCDELRNRIALHSSHVSDLHALDICSYQVQQFSGSQPRQVAPSPERCKVIWMTVARDRSVKTSCRHVRHVWLTVYVSTFHSQRIVCTQTISLS